MSYIKWEWHIGIVCVRPVDLKASENEVEVKGQRRRHVDEVMRWTQQFQRSRTCQQSDEHFHSEPRIAHRVDVEEARMWLVASLRHRQHYSRSVFTATVIAADVLTTQERHRRLTVNADRRDPHRQHTQIRPRPSHTIPACRSASTYLGTSMCYRDAHRGVRFETERSDRDENERQRNGRQHLKSYFNNSVVSTTQEQLERTV